MRIQFSLRIRRNWWSGWFDSGVTPNVFKRFKNPQLKVPFQTRKLSDSHGLYLLVNPGGSRIWYLKYRFNGEVSRVSLGAYPLVSLAEARQQSDGIRKLLAQNINPAQQRMTVKAAASSEK